MTRWTFLDYLTRRTPQPVTAQFDKVFAEMSAKERVDFMSDVIDTFNDSKERTNKSRWNAIMPDALKKAANYHNKAAQLKEIEKILDLS